MKLQVAATLARRFADGLARPVEGAGGTTASSQIKAEDLSKAIVDSEARIRAKEAMIARLTEIMRTRTGNIAQLVEAERAIAQAQEELDAARAWLIEARGRVAMSTFTIAYASEGGTGPEWREDGFWRQIGQAVARLGAIAGGSIAALILLVGTVLPWAVLIGALVFLIRWGRRRMRGAADE